MDDGPTISTHVLDTEHGTPAQGVEVRLFRLPGHTATQVGGGTTDADGRVRRVLAGQLEVGRYRLEFNVEGVFFQLVAITFEVTDASRSYHVPLLLAPYSMTTYRGS